MTEIYTSNNAGIYIHFPFCKKKCIYCNFYSVSSLSLKESFLDALLLEIEQRSNYLNNATIKTLYFGGGTPSLFSAMELERIITQLKRYYKFAPDLEFTLEGNPEQLTFTYLQALHELGVNRLSIGVQSFNNDILHHLGRLHTSEESIDAIKNAIKSGFSNVSVDLIYGITLRQSGDWERELHTLFQFPIQHLSAYSLTVEENTILSQKIKNHDISYPDEQQAITEYRQLVAIAEENHFVHYEISNFALPGFHSRHNNAYWNNIPYIGLGPAAHSYNLESRQWNCPNLKKYIYNIKHHIANFEIEYLSKINHYNEYILLKLRTNDGIDLATISRQFGEEHVASIISYFNRQSTDYYTHRDGEIQLTDEGKLLADHFAEELFLAE